MTCRFDRQAVYSMLSKNTKTLPISELARKPSNAASTSSFSERSNTVRREVNTLMRRPTGNKLRSNNVAASSTLARVALRCLVQRRACSIQLSDVSDKLTHLHLRRFVFRSYDHRTDDVARGRYYSAVERSVDRERSANDRGDVTRYRVNLLYLFVSVCFVTFPGVT